MIINVKWMDATILTNKIYMHMDKDKERHRKMNYEMRWLCVIFRNFKMCYFLQMCIHSKAAPKAHQDPQ